VWLQPLSAGWRSLVGGSPFRRSACGLPAEHEIADQGDEDDADAAPGDGCALAHAAPVLDIAALAAALPAITGQAFSFGAISAT